jgi:hypothetical protein
MKTSFIRQHPLFTLIISFPTVFKKNEAKQIRKKRIFGNLHFCQYFETALRSKIAGISATWQASKAITAAARGQEVKMCGNLLEKKSPSLEGRFCHTQVQYLLCMYGIFFALSKYTLHCLRTIRYQIIYG